MLFMVVVVVLAVARTMDGTTAAVVETGAGATEHAQLRLACQAGPVLQLTDMCE
jgi:hypothetical protein